MGVVQVPASLPDASASSGGKGARKISRKAEALSQTCVGASGGEAESELCVRSLMWLCSSWVARPARRLYTGGGPLTVVCAFKYISHN